MTRVMMGVMVLIAAVLTVAGCSIQPLDRTSAGPMDRVVNFHVTGKGVPPEGALNKGQAVLMAEKAAVADGYRKLVEKIRGVYVDAYLKTGSGVVDYDIVQAHTQAWLRGAEVLEIRQADFGITEAYMRLRINFTKKGMVWWPVGLDQEMARNYREPETMESGNSVR